MGCGREHRVVSRVGIKSRCLFDRPGRQGASMLTGMRNFAQTIFDRTAKGGSPGHAVDGCWLAREQAIMGTSIRVELWSDDRANSEAAIAAVMQEMHRIDAAMSPFKPDSELSRINREAGRNAVAVTPEMFALVQRSVEFSRASDGAFDITFASVGSLFDYRARIRPNAAAFAAARAAIGYQNLLLDAQASTVRF